MLYVLTWNQVKRTFIGMILTILATCLNVTVMAILERERAWLCIMLCTLDGKLLLECICQSLVQPNP